MREGAIRVALREHLRTLHSSEPDTLVLDEVGLCSGEVRADVVAINGSFHAYEIKSDADRLARLQRQIAGYDLVVDFATLVCSSRWVGEAMSILPPHWGVWACVPSVSGHPRLDEERPPVRNERVDARSVAQLLWREELIAELRARDAYRGLSSKPKGALWDRLVEVVPLPELQRLVRERVKARGDWRLTAKAGQEAGPQPRQGDD